MRQEAIDAIQAMDNLILRNLKITQSYYQLAEELRDFGWGANVSCPNLAPIRGQVIRDEEKR